VNIQFDIAAWKASLLGGKHSILKVVEFQKKYGLGIRQNWDSHYATARSCIHQSRFVSTIEGVVHCFPQHLKHSKTKIKVQIPNILVTYLLITIQSHMRCIHMAAC